MVKMSACQHNLLPGLGQHSDGDIGGDGDWRTKPSNMATSVHLCRSDLLCSRDLAGCLVGCVTVGGHSESLQVDSTFTRSVANGRQGGIQFRKIEIIPSFLHRCHMLRVRDACAPCSR
jgi:hypothetical protein